jgi:hypothetical protein
MYREKRMQSNSKSHQNSQNDALAQSQMMDHSESTGNASSRRSLFRRIGRRSFLGHASLFTAASAVTGVFGSSLVSKSGEGAANAQVIAAYAGEEFPPKAYQVRVAAADFCRQTAVPSHPINGDEAKYANKIATDTRGLPHNKLGEVDLKAYQSFIDALKSGDPNEYEKIVLGRVFKLVIS